MWHKSNGAICKIECTLRSSLNQLMSRDEAKIAAMMIPCQWHHTLKYLLKQIPRFVFNSYASRSHYPSPLFSPRRNMQNITDDYHHAHWRSRCKLSSRECNMPSAALKSIWQCAKSTVLSRRSRWRVSRKHRQSTLSSKLELCVEGHDAVVSLFSAVQRCIKLAKMTFFHNAGFLWYK